MLWINLDDTIDTSQAIIQGPFNTPIVIRVYKMSDGHWMAHFLFGGESSPVHLNNKFVNKRQAQEESLIITKSLIDKEFKKFWKRIK